MTPSLPDQEPRPKTTRNAILAGLAVAAGYYALSELFAGGAVVQSTPTDAAGMGGTEGGGTEGGSPPTPIGGGRLGKRDPEETEKVAAPSGWGRLSWNVPAKMVEGEGVAAYAFIDPAEAAPQPGATGEARVKTSQKMKVTLQSDPKDAIAFTPRGDEEQVLDGGSAEWSWTATPAHAGRATVTIYAWRYLKSDVGVGTNGRITGKREVTVDVRPGPKPSIGQPFVDAIKKEAPSAVGKWVGALIVGGMGALGAWLLALWKARTKKKPKPPKDDGIV